MSEISTFKSSISLEFLLTNWKIFGTVSMATRHIYLFVSLMKMLGHSIRRKELGQVSMEDISGKMGMCCCIVLCVVMVKVTI